LQELTEEQRLLVELTRWHLSVVALNRSPLDQPQNAAQDLVDATQVSVAVVVGRSVQLELECG
jgi:hypothetical protein